MPPVTASRLAPRPSARSPMDGLMLALESGGITHIVSVPGKDLEQIGRGGVSTVFRYAAPDGTDYALKLFDRPGEVPWDKLHAVMRDPDLPPMVGLDAKTGYGVAWPQGIVWRAYKPAGILLPLLQKPGWMSLDHWIEPGLLETLSPRASSLPFRLRVLRNQARGLAALHARGMAMVDVKPSNVLVHAGSGTACLIDVDSYRVPGAGLVFPATHVSAGYILPSAVGSDIDVSRLDERQDCYAFAVIVFQVMNMGIHPFQGIFPAAETLAGTYDENAGKRYYPYGRARSDVISPLPQSVHGCWPAALRSKLDSAFTADDGIPSAEDWSTYLSGLIDEDQFEACADFPHDMRHLGFPAQPCMLCQRTRAIEGLVKPRGDRERQAYHKQ